MDNARRTQWLDAALLACIYVLTASIPYGLFIKENPTLVYWLGIGTRLLFLPILLIFYLKKLVPTPTFGKLDLKALLYLPFLVLPLSNFLVVWLTRVSPYETMNPNGIWQGALLHLLVAIAEEIVFRSVLLIRFRERFNPFLSILFSSAIFGAIHLLNIGSLGDIPYAIAQSVYSFGLGMVLGMLYLTTKNILLPMILHFLFNFLNSCLVIELYPLDWNLPFFLINGAVALFGIGYWAIRYLKEWPPV